MLNPRHKNPAHKCSAAFLRQMGNKNRLLVLLRSLATGLILFIALFTVSAQKPFTKSFAVGVDILPAVLPVGSYAFKLHNDITANAGSRLGYGLNMYVYVNPVKYLIYGGSIGMSVSKVDVTNLSYDLVKFAATLDNSVRPCFCRADTLYLINSKNRVNVPVLAIIGFHLPYKKFRFTLSSGIGIINTWTPKLEFNEYFYPNQNLFGNRFEFNETIATFKPRLYVLFAYRFSTDFAYRVYKGLFVNAHFTFTGTGSKQMNYITEPGYGYNGQILTVGFGVGVSYFFGSIAEPKQSKK